MRLRRTITAACTAALLAGTHAGPATAEADPPAADPQPAEEGFPFEQIPITVNGDYQPLQGAYFCLDADTEGIDEVNPIIWYAPGPAPDAAWSFAWQVEESTMTFHASVPLTINGTYTPIVGDFDLNGCSDIIWYAPGSAPDSIWWGEHDRTFTSEPITINGTYQALVGNFSPEGAICWCADIFWYSTTGGNESIWRFSSDRELSVHAAPQVSYSDYRVTAVFDGSEWGNTHALLFHRPGPGADHAWRGVRAGQPAPEASVALSINGTYEVHPWGSSVLLYAPGPATDRVITTVHEDGTMDVADLTINGNYRVAGSSYSDLMFFHGPGTAPDSIWVAWESPYGSFFG